MIVPIAMQPQVVTRRNHAAPLPPLLAEETKIPVRRSDHPKKQSDAHFPPALHVEGWTETCWLLRKSWR